MTKRLAERKFTDEEFEKRSEALVREYAQLVKQGLPEAGVAKWNAKLEKLPETARTAISSMVEMDHTLKEAIQGDFHAFHPPGEHPGSRTR